MDETHAKLIAQEIAIVGHRIKGIEEKLQKPEGRNDQSFYDQAFMDQAMIAAMRELVRTDLRHDEIVQYCSIIAKALLEKRNKMIGGGE